MKNILLISLIYPLPTKENKGTPVCHYFTREWVKMGYTVRAVHIQAVYPHPFYWVAKINAKRIAAKTGAVVYTRRLNHAENYVMDNVPVMRIPVFKFIPHGKFSSRSVKDAVKTIIDDCKKNGFIPDVILGHFPNPQIEILSMLKTEYPNSRNCIVMHGDSEIMKNVYGNRLPALMKDINMWGFRSNAIIREFEAIIGKVNNPFMCYSGIPEQYITKHNEHTFSHSLRNFVYVGLMIERKYPEKVLEALESAYPDKDYHLTYIGEGQRLSLIKEEVEKKQLDKYISIKGRIPRDQIIKEYDRADCMVMISRGEAYGLVYLEAMARGCITIASRNEGFDGVIVDGKNGFLCEAGNANELAEIISRINNMTEQERMQISENAIETAKRLTDENAARIYIDEIIARMS